MRHNRLTTSAALAIGIAALLPTLGSTQGQAAALCFDDKQVNFAHRVLDCTAALKSDLTSRERARVHLRRGQASAAMGEGARAEADYREAVRHLDSNIAGSGSNAGALVERGAVHRALGDAQQAMDYDDMIRLEVNGALPPVNRSFLLADRKAHLRRAIADFDRALVLEVNNPEILWARADAYMLLGDQGRAMADLDLALQVAPTNARARVLHGVVNAKLGHPEKAQADYTAALAVDPDNVEALVNRSALSAVAGHTDQAIVDLDKALTLRPGNAMAHYNRGWTHFARREYQEAIADYTKALEFQPLLGWAFLNRCLTRTIAGQDPVLALGDCDEAMRLLPGNAQVRETRAFVYLKMGDPALASIEYEAALLTNPNRPLALYGRGLARIRTGDVAGGEADKKAAVALMPTVSREFTPYGLL